MTLRPPSSYGIATWPAARGGRRAPSPVIAGLRRRVSARVQTRHGAARRGAGATEGPLTPHTTARYTGQRLRTRRVCVGPTSARARMSSNTHEPDFNWHPAVHARFGEHLFFYLVRLRQAFHRPVAEQVRELLERAEIRFACEYTVFGHWDALIRVWLTSPSQHRFLKTLDRADSNVAEVRHFQAARIRHLWSGRDDDLLAPRADVRDAIASFDREIRLTVGSPNDASATRQSLIAAGLILERPAPTEDAVKFYVALRRTEDHVPQDVEERGVLQAIKNAGLAPRSSLYMGFGNFADYLIRGVADTYKDVLDWTAKVDQELQDSYLRPMTLLIADPSARESDNVNDLQALSHDDEASLALLGLDEASVARVGDLAAPQRSALNDLVRTAYELSQDDPPLRAKLRSLLRASVLGDRDSLNASLAFLLDFEWFLGEYLKRAWSEVFGKQWIAVLAARFAETPDNQRYADEVRKPDQWTLGSCVHMAMAVAEMDDNADSRLKHQLGDTWKGEVRTLLTLRNFIAHGKLRKFERLDDFAGEWGVILRDIMGAATLHFRCERLISNGG